MRRYLLLLPVLAMLTGCAQSDDEAEMTLQGRIAVKGNAPHSYLVLEDHKTHTNYKIANSQSFDLIHRQNQTVRLKAALIKEAKGPGFPAVIQVIKLEGQ